MTTTDVANGGSSESQEYTFDDLIFDEENFSVGANHSFVWNTGTDLIFTPVLNYTDINMNLQSVSGEPYRLAPYYFKTLSESSSLVMETTAELSPADGVVDVPFTLTIDAGDIYQGSHTLILRNLIAEIYNDSFTYFADTTVDLNQSYVQGENIVVTGTVQFDAPDTYNIDFRLHAAWSIDGTNSNRDTSAVIYHTIVVN